MRDRKRETRAWAQFHAATRGHAGLHLSFFISQSSMTKAAHLHYAISKRTPPSPKAWRTITDVQKELNRRLTWTHDHLTLERRAQGPGPGLGFPFVSMWRTSIGSPPSIVRDAKEEGFVPFPDAVAAGSTRIRDNLWNGHLVVAFLRHVSSRHPELAIELRDDGGFVLTGAVRIQNGIVAPNHEWLNRARVRALETTGDPEAAVPYLWAEVEALEGRHFAESSAADYAEVPEIRELDMDWEQLASVPLADLATHVVERVTREVAVPEAA
ncbi:MAG: hypothetical protein M5U28_27935 [Sandaracinaceae bacterium]|nr:hypothetical protein [Sandaracinaceae bacterium]